MDISAALNPLDSLVDAGAKLLGISPQIAAFIKEGIDLAKIAGGAASGNVALAMDGAQGLATNLASQLTKPKTEYTSSTSKNSGTLSSNSGSATTTVKTPPPSSGSTSGGTTGYASGSATTTTTTTDQSYMALFIAEMAATTSTTTKPQVLSPAAAQKTSSVSGALSQAASAAKTSAKTSALTDASSTPPAATPAATSAAAPASPPDPLAAARLSALQTISKDFATADGAGAFGKFQDGLMGMNDLQALANDPMTPTDLRTAAQFFVDHATEFAAMQSSNATYVNLAEVNAALAKATAAKPAALATPSAPAAPSTDPLLDKRISALQVITNNFNMADAAGAFFGGDDGLLGMNDLQALVADQTIPADVRTAAKFFIDNPKEFSNLEGADAPYVKLASMNAALATATATKQGLSAPASTSSTAASGTSGTSSTSSTSATSTTSSTSTATPDPLAQARVDALKTLKSNFDSVEIEGAAIKQTDGLLGMDDLKALVNDNTVSADVKKAAQFFIDHPEEYNAIAKSGTAPKYISKSDMDDAYTAALAKLSSSNAASGTVVTAINNQNAVQGIVNNPNMTIDEKIKQILFLVMDSMDNQELQLTQQISNLSDQKDGLDQSDPKNQSQTSDLQTQIDKANVSLQDMSQKRQSMFTLLSNMTLKQGEMTMQAITNLGQH